MSTIRTKSISQLVKELQDIEEKHGDLDVLVPGYEGGYHSPVIDGGCETINGPVSVMFFKESPWYYGSWWFEDDTYERKSAPDAPTVPCVILGRGIAYLTDSEENGSTEL